MDGVSELSVLLCRFGRRNIKDDRMLILAPPNILDFRGKGQSVVIKQKSYKNSISASEESVTAGECSPRLAHCMLNWR